VPILRTSRSRHGKNHCSTSTNTVLRFSTTIQEKNPPVTWPDSISEANTKNAKKPKTKILGEY